MKIWKLALAVLGLAVCAGQVRAQGDWPQQTIRWIVPYPAGGPSDIIARKVALLASSTLKQTIIIENKTGAGGTLGASEVAQAKPDGYTYLYTIGDPLISGAMIVKPAYNSNKDFIYVTQVTAAPNVMISNPDLPETLAKLVELGKAKPDSISYGTFGDGSMPHLTTEALTKLTGAKFTRAGYRGIQDALRDVVTKYVGFTFVAPTSAAEFVRDGRARALVVTGEKRSPVLPDVPTFKELGFNDPLLVRTTWAGLMSPRGVPPAIIEKMGAAVREAVRSPEITDFLTKAGSEPIGSTSEVFTAQFVAEYDAVEKIMKTLDIKPQQ